MPARPFHTQARMLLSSLIAEWLTRTEGRFTDQTRGLYSWVIWRFRDSMPDNIGDVTLEHVERYLSKIPKNRTKNCHLTVLRSFYRWISDHYELPNIAGKIKMYPEDPPYRRLLSQEEYQKLLFVCNEHQADVIRFLSNTGIRAGEFQSLKWDNVSDDYKTLVVGGKGRKRRLVPLNDVCQTILKKEPRKPNQFLNLSKNYQYRSAVCHLCHRLSKKAGIPVAGPHALRRLFATELAKQGKSLKVISALLGHSSVRTTEAYLGLLPSELRGSTDGLGL